MCGPRKGRALRARLAQVKANRFITLTHAPKPNESPLQALRAMRADWHRLYYRLRRRHPKASLKYVAVVEWTKAGWPHLHIVADMKYIPQRQLSREWKALHGAPIVDIRRIKSARQVANYLSNYLTKPTTMPYRMRHWSATRKFLPPLPTYQWPEYTERPEWVYTQIPPIHYAHSLEQNGHLTIEGPSNTILAIPTAATRPPPT